MSNGAKRISLAAAVVAFVLSVCAAMILFLPQAVRAEGNDTSAFNCELSGETTAVTVSYAGEYTGTYGIQAYAGLSGNAWIAGSQVIFCNYGAASHSLGNNTGDAEGGRKALSVTLSVDAQEAGQAYVFLFVETTDGQKFSVTVNDGEPQSVELYDTFGLTAERTLPTRPCAFAVSLNAGINTIVIKTADDYTCWFHTFAISPVIDPVLVASEQKQTFPIASWKEFGGDLTVQTEAIGLNAFDNAADYGKTGYAVYDIYAKEAGTYTFGMYAMAGNTLANRAKLTLNNSVLQFDGKEYYSFDTSAAWGGDTWNYITLALHEGNNTLKIENSLTRVNADKTQEVADGTEGSVLVSNWWMHTLSLEKRAKYYLKVDTSGAVTSYNPKREVKTEGIKVSVYEGETLLKELTASEYETSVSGNDVTVTYTGSDYVGVQSASYSVSRTTEGLPYEGKEVVFDGENSTGKLSYYMYAAIKGEGTGVCEGRLFWVMDAQPAGDGYIFGSGGVGTSENRQMTLTLRIQNNGEAGTYLFRSYVNSNNYEYNGIQIKINDGEYISVNMNGPKQGEDLLPFVYALDLQTGENTVELKLCDQYSAWFETFEIAPIMYEDKAAYAVHDASREGAGCFNTATGIFVGNIYDRSLTYYISADKQGKYELGFKVAAVAGKTLKVSVDGNEPVSLTTTGTDTVATVQELTAGDHTVKVIFEGEAGNIDFSGMTKTYCRAVESMRLDTSEMKLTLDFGNNPNFAKLKVYVLYEGDDSETLIESGYAIDTGNFTAEEAGEYTITVYMTADPDVKETFTITVKAALSVTGIKADATALGEVENGTDPDISKVVVMLVYNDGTEIRAMTGDYTITAPEGFDNKKAGEYTFTVKYAKDASITAQFKVVVKAASDGATGGEPEAPEGVNPLAWIIPVVAAVVIGGAIAAVIIVKKKKNK